MQGGHPSAPSHRVACSLLGCLVPTPSSISTAKGPLKEKSSSGSPATVSSQKNKAIIYSILINYFKNSKVIGNKMLQNCRNLWFFFFFFFKTSSCSSMLLLQLEFFCSLTAAYTNPNIIYLITTHNPTVSSGRYYHQRRSCRYRNGIKK